MILSHLHLISEEVVAFNYELEKYLRIIVES